MRRWQRVDPDGDIPDTAGYNVDGTVRYIDRDAFRAILDPEYAKHILGEVIDTGISPEDTIKDILEHEAIEKVVLDADNPIEHYPDAHEFATCGEHEKVRQQGGRPLKYERGLKEIIKFCEQKKLARVPRDLCCAPYLDDPDADDKRAIKQMRSLGVVDAFKLGKRPVEYAKSTSEDQCHLCKSWMGPRQMQLSPCQKVEGLVRQDRWCKEFTRVGAQDAAGQSPEQQNASSVASKLPARRSAEQPSSRATDAQPDVLPGGGPAAPAQPPVGGLRPAQ